MSIRSKNAYLDKPNQLVDLGYWLGEIGSSGNIGSPLTLADAAALNVLTGQLIKGDKVVFYDKSERQ